MITPEQLRRAKRDHEKTVAAVRNTVYENRSMFFVEGRPLNSAASDLTYFHATVANAKQFEKVVARFSAAFADRLVAAGAMDALKLRVEAARQSYESIAKVVAEQKKQLAAKREERAAREQQKRDLGVDLKKIDERATPATFAKIIEQLEPVRAHYAALIAERHHATAKRQLPLADLRAQRAERIDYGYFRTERDCVTLRYVTTLRPDLDEYIAKRAQAEAAEIVAEFAGKMAGKIDRERAEGASVVSATISTANLWSNSTLRVAMSDGSTQEWYTTMILNTSVHGKLFNQWPTRRVS